MRMPTTELGARIFLNVFSSIFSVITICVSSGAKLCARLLGFLIKNKVYQLKAAIRSCAPRTLIGFFMTMRAVRE